jgi:uncharacterized membrane protein
MERERQLRIFAVVVGVALVAFAVAIIISGSTREIAGGAVVIAAIAVFWTIFFSARLESYMEAIARDVHQIADRVAPTGEETATPELVDEPTLTEPGPRPE